MIKFEQYNPPNDDLFNKAQDEFNPEGAVPILHRTGELHAAKRLVNRLLMAGFTWDEVRGLTLGKVKIDPYDATQPRTYQVTDFSGTLVAFPGLGNDGQVLTSQGATLQPAWETLPSSSAKQFHFIGPYDGNSIGFGVTRYSGFVGNSVTETDIQWVVPMAGTIKNLYFRSSANTVNGSTTITMMKNGIAQSLTVTFGASTAGVQSDIVNSFTVAAGDLISTRIVTGGTSGTFTFGGSTIEFDPS